MDPDAAELRVLGCLIEKQRTTPDQYPLTLNALRLACNQATNRDPVVNYDEHTVREAAQALGRRRWSRLASGQGSRAPKYRHLLDETLGIGDDELAVLSVLLLRGPQTPGELKARTERMHRFESLEELQFTVEKLIRRGHVARLERRPGQKEERYAQLFGGDGTPAAPSAAAEHHGMPTTASAAAAFPAATPAAAAGPISVAATAAGPATAPPTPSADSARIDELEALTRSLRDDLDALRAQITSLRNDLGA